MRYLILSPAGEPIEEFLEGQLDQARDFIHATNNVIQYIPETEHESSNMSDDREIVE